MSEDAHLKEMAGIMPAHVPLNKDELEIECRMNNAVLKDPASAYEGYELWGDPSDINIAEVLRQRRMWKCYDQQSFGFMRYNMFQDKGDWFPGSYALPENVAKVDQANTPVELDLKHMLSETHEHFYKPKDGDKK
jgi:predicted aldo/keto reductase-like oxidoreductase